MPQFDKGAFSDGLYMNGTEEGCKPARVLEWAGRTWSLPLTLGRPPDRPPPPSR